MSGRAAVTYGAAAVAAFAVAFVVGNSLGEDERPAARQAPAKQAATTTLGPLRLEPVPALPELRSAPAKPKPGPAPAAPSGPAAPEPVGESEDVPAETGGYAAPTPAPPVSSPPPAEPAPVAPAPQSEPPPPTTAPPQPAAPEPDPAPAPAPAPMPDPSPSGGSGQYSGP